MMNMATIVLEVVIVAVVSNSFRVVLYKGCWRMLAAAVEKLANMHQMTRKLLFADRVMPGRKIMG